ncbi:MAG: WG repeat-containing protein [Planctomycetota bacterium]|nr:WG repeat-containing protein [Planctomycetota bacterium]
MIIVILIFSLSCSIAVTEEQRGIVAFPSMTQLYCFSEDGGKRELLFSFSNPLVSTPYVAFRPDVYPVFSNGLVPAFDRGTSKYGYINRSGQFSIDPQFDAAFSFQCGRAVVVVGTKYGVIGTDGGIIVEYGVYKHISHFSNGLAAVVSKKDKIGYIDDGGKEVVPCKYSLVEDRCMTTEKGMLLFRVPAFHDGYAVVREAGGALLFISRLGTELRTPYEPVSHFNDGFAVVKAGDGFDYIDKRGKLLLENPVEVAEQFSHGLAYIENNGEKAFIDTHGKIVLRIRANWKYISGFSGERNELACFSKGDEYFYIDTDGQKKFRSFYRAEGFHSGFARVDPDKASRSRAVLTETGEVLYECDPMQLRASVGVVSAYDSLFPKPKLQDSQFLTVRLYRVYIPFNNPANPQFFQDPASYPSVSNRDAKGLYPFKKNKKYGYENSVGKTVISPKYDYAFDFEGDYALAFSGELKDGHLIFEEQILVSRKGEEIYRTENKLVYLSGNTMFESPYLNTFYACDIYGERLSEESFFDIRPFSEGLAFVKRRKGEKFALVDSDLRFLTDAVFEDARCFSEGLSAVKIDGKYGYIDGQGNIKIAPVFWMAEEFVEGSAVVGYGPGSYLIDKTGTRVTPEVFGIERFEYSRFTEHYNELMRYKVSFGLLEVSGFMR